jgi:hypothetical protein
MDAPGMAKGSVERSIHLAGPWGLLREEAIQGSNPLEVPNLPFILEVPNLPSQITEGTERGSDDDLPGLVESSESENDLPSGAAGGSFSYRVPRRDSTSSSDSPEGSGEHEGWGHPQGGKWDTSKGVRWSNLCCDYEMFHSAVDLRHLSREVSCREWPKDFPSQASAYAIISSQEQVRAREVVMSQQSLSNDFTVYLGAKGSGPAEDTGMVGVKVYQHQCLGFLRFLHPQAQPDVPFSSMVDELQEEDRVLLQSIMPLYGYARGFLAGMECFSNPKGDIREVLRECHEAEVSLMRVAGHDARISQLEGSARNEISDLHALTRQLEEKLEAAVFKPTLREHPSKPPMMVSSSESEDFQGSDEEENPMERDLPFGCSEFKIFDYYQNQFIRLGDFLVWDVSLGRKVHLISRGFLNTKINRDNGWAAQVLKRPPPTFVAAGCGFGSSNTVPEIENKRPWWASSLLAKAAAEGLRVLSCQEEQSLGEYDSKTWQGRNQVEDFVYVQDEDRSMGEGPDLGSGLLAPELGSGLLAPEAD